LDLARPGAGGRMLREVVRVDAVLGAGWNVRQVRRQLARTIPRYAARDCLLDGLSDAQAMERFEFSGDAPARELLANGRGVVFVGAHFGAHLPLLNAFHRTGMNVRLLVQRPSHTSRYLQKRFDRDEPLPQSRFFVRRGLSTCEAAEKILLARGALRSGVGVYINGDILWEGANTRMGSLLGHSRRLLALWADLAILTNSPVVFVRASFSPRGKYRFKFDEPIVVQEGRQQDVFELYLRRLESAIADDPSSSIPYLTWPVFMKTIQDEPRKVL